jgi:transposase
MTYSIDLKRRVLQCKKSKRYTDTEIIKIFKISSDTFYKWIKEEQNNKFGSKTRKPKINYNIEKYIIKYVTTRINFKCPKLIRIINTKFNIKISKSSIYNILKKHKIKKKKIIIKQILSDPQKRIEQINTFKNELKNVSMFNIISLDEVSVDSHIGHNYGWSKSGVKVTSIKTFNRIRYSVICAISCRKIIHKETIKGSINAVIFLNFIKNLFKKLLSTENYIILDNARIHHSKILKSFIEKIKNAKLIYNVPYSPEYNPIEMVFSEVKKYLRDKDINNNNIVPEINSAFQNVKSDNLKQYFKKSLNFIDF